MWNPQARTTRCLTCPAALSPDPSVGESPLDLGVAGASAQRQYEAREGRRRARVRADPAAVALYGGAGAAMGTVLTIFLHLHNPLLIVVLTVAGLLKPLATPQHIAAWRSGAEGERAVGATLDGLRAHGVLTLHDRRIPGSRANIDHIAVAPTGIFVVDAKNVAGKVRVDRRGISVAGRLREAMLAGAQRQARIVQEMLADQPLPPGMVRGVLCFTRADLPWPCPMPGGIALLSRRGLARELRRPGPLAPDQVRHLATLLAQRLPVA